MKIKYKKLLVLLILFAFVISDLTYNFIINNGIFNESYDTIQQTVSENKSLQKSTIIEIIEDNGLAFVFCEYQNQATLEYLYKSPKGWQVITKEFNHSKKNKNTKYYWLDYIEYNEKNIFVITNSVLSLKNESEPTDSLNSQFIRFGREDKLVNTYWMLVLDEIPKDYSITIFGDNIPIETE